MDDVLQIKRVIVSRVGLDLIAILLIPIVQKVVIMVGIVIMPQLHVHVYILTLVLSVMIYIVVMVEQI